MSIINNWEIVVQVAFHILCELTALLFYVRIVFCMFKHKAVSTRYQKFILVQCMIGIGNCVSCPLAAFGLGENWTYHLFLTVNMVLTEGSIITTFITSCVLIRKLLMKKSCCCKGITALIVYVAVDGARVLLFNIKWIFYLKGNQELALKLDTATHITDTIYRGIQCAIAVILPIFFRTISTDNLSERTKLSAKRLFKGLIIQSIFCFVYAVLDIWNNAVFTYPEMPYEDEGWKRIVSYITRDILPMTLPICKAIVLHYSVRGLLKEKKEPNVQKTTPATIMTSMPRSNVVHPM